MNKTYKNYAVLLLTAALIPLAACQTTGSSSYADQSQKIDQVLARAAADAARKDDTKESLALLEQMYKRDSQKPENALKYASALRKAERYNRANLVLKPFAVKGKNSDILAEYAAIHSAMGNYSVAEDYAREAVLLKPDSSQAYHILGVALDAQGHHPQAEVAFRKALDHWTGDPAPVLNNLGLNLAAQGFIDDALDILHKAAAVSPDRGEIERNIRIVSALQSQSSRHRPIPETKPQKPVEPVPVIEEEVSAAPVAEVETDVLEETPAPRQQGFYRD